MRCEGFAHQPAITGMTKLLVGVVTATALYLNAAAASASYYCVEKKTVTVAGHSASTPVVCVPGP